MSDFSNLDRERLEILDGSRGSKTDARLRQAVRVVDFQGLLMIQKDLQSAHAAGAAPTAAEFDLLVDDVRKLHERLRAVAEALSLKLR